jgi:hypothetical protein
MDENAFQKLFLVDRLILTDDIFDLFSLYSWENSFTLTPDQRYHSIMEMSEVAGPVQVIYEIVLLHSWSTKLSIGIRRRNNWRMQLPSLPGQLQIRRWKIQEGAKNPPCAMIWTGKNTTLPAVCSVLGV